MIFDNIKNCEMYYGVNEKFKKAFEFIKKAVEENFEVGVYEIDGKEIYASVQNYDSKLMETCLFEGHEKYIDIQYIVSGAEYVEVTDIAKAQPITEYNEEKDVQFYQAKETVWKGVWTANDYGIFFPHDIHRPGMRVDGISAPAKKILVKIKL